MTSNFKRLGAHLARVVATASALLATGLGIVQAQDFPSRAVTLVVPFAAGGGTDSIARDVARIMTERLGKPVVVDNRGGAGGAIAAAAVAKAAPDGHTLLFVTSTFVTHAASDPTPGYDVLKDFAPVAMIGRGPLLLVTSRELGAASVSQLIDMAKKQPAGLTYCSAGNGSINHLSAEMFNQRAGVSMTHVPYRGSGPATLDLLAGRVQVFFATVPTIGALVRENRVKALAVTGKRRSPLFASLPTIAESGLGDFDVTTWWGVVAPAGTPQAVITRLNELVNEATATPSVQTRLTNEGAESFKGSAASFQGVLATELDAWRGVVKSGGFKLN